MRSWRALKVFPETPPTIKKHAYQAAVSSGAVCFKKGGYIGVLPIEVVGDLYQAAIYTEHPAKSTDIWR